MLYSELSSCLVVESPEHAHLLASHGWGKPQVRRYVVERAVWNRRAMERAGKIGVSRDMYWLVPAEHSDALAGAEPTLERRGGTDVHVCRNRPTTSPSSWPVPRSPEC